MQKIEITARIPKSETNCAQKFKILLNKLIVEAILLFQFTGLDTDWIWILTMFRYWLDMDIKLV